MSHLLWSRLHLLLGSAFHPVLTREHGLEAAMGWNCTWYYGAVCAFRFNPAENAIIADRNICSQTIICSEACTELQQMQVQLSKDAHRSVWEIISHHRNQQLLIVKGDKTVWVMQILCLFGVLLTNWLLGFQLEYSSHFTVALTSLSLSKHRCGLFGNPYPVYLSFAIICTH